MRCTIPHAHGALVLEIPVELRHAQHCLHEHCHKAQELHKHWHRQQQVGQHSHCQREGQGELNVAQKVSPLPEITQVKICTSIKRCELYMYYVYMYSKSLKKYISKIPHPPYPQQQSIKSTWNREQRKRSLKTKWKRFTQKDEQEETTKHTIYSGLDKREHGRISLIYMYIDTYSENLGILDRYDSTTVEFTNTDTSS